MPKFAILMREDDGAWAKLPEAEQGRLMNFYFAWVEDLRARGAFVAGAPFAGGGRVVRVSPETRAIVDEPFAESKQVLTGYFLIEAPDLAAAAAIARTCPALIHGETVELRPIGHE